MDLFEYELTFCPEDCRKPPPIQIVYGTSGFRFHSKYMKTLVYRVGILSSLRAKFTKENVGVMITASHNPEEDNGVKIVDGRGSMLERSWETIATDFCKLEHSEIYDFVKNLLTKYGIDILQNTTVFIGRDTRPSGLELCEALISGITALPFSSYYNYGMVTSPMLHFFVYKFHLEKASKGESYYYESLNSAYLEFKRYGNRIDKNHEVVIDGANGIGSVSLKNLKNYISDLDHVVIKNAVDDGKLNYQCGADYVKMNKGPHESFDYLPGHLCVSFDGDADRIIYFYKSHNKEVFLLDGDYIACLFLHYFLDCLNNITEKHDLQIGLICTLYSNGATVNWAKDKNISVALTKTGVKFLHERAESYDIGVYFEANGHGTALFSNKAIDFLMNVPKENELSFKYSRKLLALTSMINQSCGDAISIFLTVECILHDLEVSIDWWKNLITPFPNWQLKVFCNYKNRIKTTDDEQSVLEPENMQNEINQIVQKFPSARAFVRPSGTEDVVRVYAEAPLLDDVKKICDEIQSLVVKYCN